jgi:hypothetical protein
VDTQTVKSRVWKLVIVPVSFQDAPSHASHPLGGQVVFDIVRGGTLRPAGVTRTSVAFSKSPPPLNTDIETYPQARKGIPCPQAVVRAAGVEPARGLPPYGF